MPRTCRCLSLLLLASLVACERPADISLFPDESDAPQRVRTPGQAATSAMENTGNNPLYQGSSTSSTNDYLPYSVDELKTLQTLPKTAIVRGEITTLDISISDPMQLSVVLDGTLRCEVSLKQAYSSSASMRLTRQGNDLLLTRNQRSQSDGKNVETKVFFRIGQRIAVKGAFNMSTNGRVVLKGVLIR